MANSLNSAPVSTFDSFTAVLEEDYFHQSQGLPGCQESANYRPISANYSSPWGPIFERPWGRGYPKWTIVRGFLLKETFHGFDALMVFLVSDSFVQKTSSSQKAITMNSPGPSSGKIMPLQQMLASGSGALITSLLGKTLAYTLAYVFFYVVANVSRLCSLI